jgi:phosphoribosylglycinamide formyltransferase-1
MTPVGVLASGTGSNLAALIRACQGDHPARVVVAGSDRPACAALERARDAGVPTFALRARDFADRDAFDAAMADALDAHGVRWVCLAGYMRLVGSAFLARFGGRVLNIHPSLLPAFPGLDAVGQALRAGVRETGCTVHLVDEGLDSGPILGARTVPVVAGDDAHSLAARIHDAEHLLYAAVLARCVSHEERAAAR